MAAGATKRVIYAEHLAARMRAARRRLKLSQTEIAQALGVHRNTVYRWEMAEKIPDAFQLTELRSYLKDRGDGL